MELVPYIDATGAGALETFVRQARNGGTEVWLCGMQRQPLDFLARMKPPFAGARRARTYEGTLRRLILARGPGRHAHPADRLVGLARPVPRAAAARRRAMTSSASTSRPAPTPT